VNEQQLTMTVTLAKTCDSCPEQYDAYFGDECIGYLRLRHGKFTATYPDVGGDLVFSGEPIGDGSFLPDERDKWLYAGCAALLARTMGAKMTTLHEVIGNRLAEIDRIWREEGYWDTDEYMEMVAPLHQALLELAKKEGASHEANMPGRADMAVLQADNGPSEAPARTE
jgi:hypothetical protein